MTALTFRTVMVTRCYTTLWGTTETYDTLRCATHPRTPPTSGCPETSLQENRYPCVTLITCTVGPINSLRRATTSKHSLKLI